MSGIKVQKWQIEGEIFYSLSWTVGSFDQPGNVLQSTVRMTPLEWSSLRKAMGAAELGPVTMDIPGPAAPFALEHLGHRP